MDGALVAVGALHLQVEPMVWDDSPKHFYSKTDTWAGQTPKENALF